MKQISSKHPSASHFDLLLVIFLSTCCRVVAQAPLSYLNQKPPGRVAELFAPGIVSTELYEHSAPAFSPDGTIVLWTVIEGKSYFLESRLENGEWTKPVRSSFNDSTVNVVYPSFSPDGKKLLFSSDRKLPAGYRQGRGNHLWQVERTANGWGQPAPFDTTASKGGDYAHSMASSGTLYFSSGLGEATNWNLRKAEKKNGVYAVPQLLPFNINSKGYEDGAFIAPDESFLIFESQRPEGTDGNLSLFISFRNSKGQWSLPVNMGPSINSGKGERFARLSPDGRCLFFGSFRNSSPTRRGADIFWIDAGIIEELRQSEAAKKFFDPSLGTEVLEALNSKDAPRTEALLAKWRQAHPGHLDALLLHSAALRLQGRSAAAEKLLMAEPGLDEKSVAVQLEKGLLQYGQQNDEAAEKILALLLQDEGERFTRLRYLSEELFSMKRYEASDAYFKQVMSIRPNATAAYNRACAYALAGEKEKAFTYLNTAIDLGFTDKKHYAEDADLASLHGDSRWAILLARLK